MTILELSSLTDEYVKVRVSAKQDGQSVDPTGNLVELAFMVEGPPDVADWLTGEWETDTTTNPDTYYTRRLTGLLDPGSYEVWVRITDSPEVVVRKVGPMIVDD